MKLVLRFQTNDGVGPYSAGGVAGDYFNCDAHPLPTHDGGLSHWWRTLSWDDAGQYLFGFCSVDQARAWFYEYECLEAMGEEDGIKLILVAVPDDAVKVGFAQTVFKKHVGVLIAEFEPTALHLPEFEEVYKTLELEADKLVA